MAELELLRTEMEAACRGAAEAREALSQSAELGQLLLSRNEALEQELEVLRLEKSRIAASEASRRQRLEEECRRLELELEQRDGQRARQQRLQSAASADSDEELSMEQMRQRLKRSEQSEREHRDAACLAEEHAAALEEKHQKLEDEHRKLQAGRCTALHRWRRAGSAVVQRLSAGQLGFAGEVPAAKSAPESAKDADHELSLPSPSAPSSPSRRSERSEDWPSWPQLELLASERDAARAEKAQMESQSQELEQENTTLRLLLEEESQRTQALLQQVDYLAELLEERQTQSGARDMLKSLGLSREPSPDGALAACDAHATEKSQPREPEEVKFQLRSRDRSRGPAEAQSLESFLADLRSRSPSVSRKRRPPHVTLEDFLGEKPSCLFDVTASTRAAARLPGQEQRKVQPPSQASLLELLGWRRCQACGSLTWSPLGQRKLQSAKAWTFALDQDARASQTTRGRSLAQ
ncbi:unnamed protein product [Symbiodinium sp. CCMP2456]|nr:unnamed protein product [Symbiodinium sp. CCMP2456]